ncbi:hypothetical protein [Aestuariicoccus sp. MJ-SS9]|uniref:hypothetical protein n=1 Tax=Aestuariicoccus sp. MJ-SS9 TaxID=3079855 RepID=UPI002908F321|nr:hypothetical protein [Aestuariicoccus sp. MJ-SS9]MDU8913172.1 hypothetical protein [Aestuariicoccus sp. MJ-SS9]
MAQLGIDLERLSNAAVTVSFGLRVGDGPVAGIDARIHEACGPPRLASRQTRIRRRAPTPASSARWTR